MRTRAAPYVAHPQRVNKEGMAMLGMEYDRNVWKKTFVERIQDYGRRRWRNGFGINRVCTHEEQTKKMINMQMAVWEQE